MHFKTPTAGNYTISLDHVDGLFTGNQEIYLRDNLTGIEHDIKDGAYDFATEAGAFSDRFEVIYQQTLGTDNPANVKRDIIAFKASDEIVVNSGKYPMKSIMVYDVGGRLLHVASDLNDVEARFAAPSAEQVLMLYVTCQDGVLVTKKIVN